MHQRPYHILVVHENQHRLNEAVSLLKRSDYIAAGATTTDETNWWLDGWPVDLLVAPPQFNAMSGLNLVLTARARQPDISGLLIDTDDTHADIAEARRQGVQIVRPGVTATEFVKRVAECLAVKLRRPRWPRKEITSAVSMRVGASSGRLVDVSYGGLKFELTDDSYVLRSPVIIDFPRADLRFQADVVWSARQDDSRSCAFGAAIQAPPMTATEWRAFVDRLA